tara:strand:- start:413 stop:1177 length:765 start_codon:yes stop_codon:yes gene_type:complete
VICRVQNEEGLVSDVEILVTVTDAESANEIGLDDFLMALGAILLLLVFSFMAYLRIASNRRMAALLAESETEAEEDLAASREPSAEEQKAMWGGSSGTLSNTQPMAIGDIASGMSGASSPESEATSLEISEEEFSELLSQPSPSEPSGSLAADLLSAFEDEDDAQSQIQESVVEYSFPEESENQEGAEVGHGLEQSTQSQDHVQEEVQKPEESRTVRKNCSECDKMFEVDLPDGLDRAKTACPHCGSIEIVELE